jgi:hypothetical protein
MTFEIRQCHRTHKNYKVLGDKSYILYFAETFIELKNLKLNLNQCR